MRASNPIRRAQIQAEGEAQSCKLSSAMLERLSRSVLPNFRALRRWETGRCTARQRDQGARSCVTLHPSGAHSRAVRGTPIH